MDELKVLQHLYQITGIALPQEERRDLRKSLERNGLINEINSLWKTYTEDMEIKKRREIMQTYQEGKRNGITEGRSETRGNGWVWTGASD